MEILHLTLNDFEANVTEAKGLVLVDFYADWCGPCKMLSPVLESLAAERDDLKVCKLNVDEAYPIADHFGISAIPAVILFENGEVKAKNVGYCEKEELIRTLGL